MCDAIPCNRSNRQMSVLFKNLTIACVAFLGAINILEATKQYEVCGEAADDSQTLELATRLALVQRV